MHGFGSTNNWIYCGYFLRLYFRWLVFFLLFKIVFRIDKFLHRWHSFYMFCNDERISVIETQLGNESNISWKCLFSLICRCCCLFFFFLQTIKSNSMGQIDNWQQNTKPSWYTSNDEGRRQKKYIAHFHCSERWHDFWQTLSNRLFFTMDFNIFSFVFWFCKEFWIFFFFFWIFRSKTKQWKWSDNSIKRQQKKHFLHDEFPVLVIKPQTTATTNNKNLKKKRRATAAANNFFFFEAKLLH